MPFCQPADIDRHVREVVEALGSPEGGLWLNAEVDDGVPLENIEALCEALEKYRGYFRTAAGPVAVVGTCRRAGPLCVACGMRTSTTGASQRQTGSKSWSRPP